MTLPVDDAGERDTRMTGTYVGVLILEAALIVVLIIFGRLFS